MRKHTLALIGTGLALAFVAGPATANIKKKAAAPNRSFIRQSSSVVPAQYWYIWVDGFETRAQTATTYQAIGVNWNKSVGAGQFVNTTSPGSCYGSLGMGSITVFDRSQRPRGTV